MAQGDTSTENEVEERGLLDSKPVRWTLIYVFPAVVCLMGGAAIYVSQLTVDQDIHIMAQRSWAPGQPSALRVLAYGDRGALLDQVGVELSLGRPDGETAELSSVRAGPGITAVDLDVQVPSWEEGEYELKALVVTPTGREEVTTEIVLAGKRPSPTLHLPPPPADRPRGDTSAHEIDGVNVEILPYGHVLVPNLTNPLFLRTTDAEGRPLSVEVRIRLVAGVLRDPLPETVRTDPLGLALLSAHPLSNDIGIEVMPAGSAVSSPPAASADGGPPPASEADASGDAGADPPIPAARIQVATGPSGLVLRLRSPLPDASEDLSVAVESLHASRPLYVDAYRNGDWIASRTTVLRQSRAKVSIPTAPQGLMLVQAYTSPVSVGHGFSAHHLYVRGADEDDDDVLAAIAAILRERDMGGPYLDAVMEGRLYARPGARVERAAAFLLSRLDRGYVPPERLVSSEQVRSAELTSFQRGFRVRISIGIGILGLIVTVLVAYSFSVAAYRARKRRLAWDASTGANEEDLYVTSMGRPRGLDRIRTVVQIALMVGVVAAGFVLLAVLVLVMSWHGY